MGRRLLVSTAGLVRYFNGLIPREANRRGRIRSETEMAAKNKVTVSSGTSKHALTATERRAAQVAVVATRQADLKREAAERRASRAETAR
jgi:hypothetical protein